MGRLLLVLLILLAIGLALAAPDPAASEALFAGIAAMWDAGIGGLCEIAELDRALHAEVWGWFPGRLRALLGGLKCLGTLLVLIGLFALRGLGRIGRRYL
jgi:hypothetical protein